MARYEEIVLASGEVPLDVLTDVAVAEMTVALSMEWVEQADGSWRNDEIPGLAMVVERLGECWCWHVSGGKGAFRANYGVSSAMFEACNKAIEAVTGIDPSDDYLPLGNLGVI
jgi:hypothetical protein